MAVTRDDVAAAAGVSPAVVSYVINNGPRPVSPSTRARVMAAVERLGYRPDGRARSLRTRRSGSLGLVVPAGVDLATGAGDITLTVPAGSYRCDFTIPGDPDVDGVTCDPAATTVLTVDIDDGSLSVEGVAP